MKILILVLAIIAVCSIALAEQRYNAFEGRWETVPSGSNWRTQYNAFEQEWSYQPDNARTEYNAFEQKWEWDSGVNNYNRRSR